MKQFMRGAIALALCAAATLACAFPDKPVRLVVPYPAGGPVDIATRIVAERLTAAWGQPVVVDNRPGASGAIGTEHVVKSPADGHTLLVHSPIMLATELIRPGVGYRTLRDLVPVSLVLATPVVYVASNASTKGGIPEILAAAAARPGELSFGSHGDGTTAHYLGEKLARASRVPMTHVPYAGEAPILTALMGGHVMTSFVSGIGARKLAETGKARMLAVASRSRSPLLPGVPTFLELGYAGFDRSSWAMVFAPAGTPAGVVEQAARDIDRIVQQPDIQQRFAALGMEARGGAPADALRELQEDHAYWVALVKDFGALATQ
ncbi:tripartite tricarboxylate transporter substrate binding protein [Pseudorhodoferax sp.]|uniref:tripartite tricarboxylate transporter substrate binding protein n=1 Tax=Pseudorhodoferax sp. TaxID=1993553 RepID=UPI002DD67F01|nr:tripartite tricarboxylate transporter substrate binding protein [Pseudorhodoferax sp.]